MILASRILTHLRFLAVIPLFAALGGANAEDTAQRGGSGIEFSDGELGIIRGMSPLPPTPGDETNAFANNPRAARFGQFLFFDRRLSANERVACSTWLSSSSWKARWLPSPVSWSRRASAMAAW